MTTSCCGAFAMPVEIPSVPRRTLPPRPFQLRGGHVLAMLIAFFAIVGGVNALMIGIALRTMPGLDARNGYDASQNFNAAELLAAQAQTKRGWRSEASLRLAGRNLVIEARFRDPSGAPISALAVTARLAHPAMRALDREIALSARGDGLYAARLDGVEPGGWGLALEARQARDGERLYLSRHRLVLRDEAR